METKFSFQLLHSIFFLVLLNPFSVSPHQPTPMNFLKTLAGAQKGSTVPGISQLKKYLTSIGHMNPNIAQAQNQYDDFLDDSLEQAIRSYQTFFKLTVTGDLDPHTLAQMNRPRCGVPDKLGHSHNNHTFHRSMVTSLYAFFNGQPKWPPNKRSLSYSFPSGTRPDVIPAIHGAVQEWTAHSPFKFVQIPKYNQADVKISFQVKDHGDGSSFDGPGGILAHAFAPPDGRLHFDGDEPWVNGEQMGKMDLQTVGLHELGHILGLMHSTDQNAIMWPYIDYGRRKHLDQDDIAGIKALYK